LKGHYYVSEDFSAVPCPLNTYNANETTLPYCTDCPFGWLTQKEGADGAGSCLAPPGFELKDGNDNITECEIGFYKADWNRNNCTKVQQETAQFMAAEAATKVTGACCNGRQPPRLARKAAIILIELMGGSLFNSLQQLIICSMLCIPICDIKR
jgi:hypothetical protein